jgi:hypothetical protein
VQTGQSHHEYRRESDYNAAMREYTTEDLVIGVVAAVGVLVLIAVFVYVVRQLFSQKGE